MINTINTSDATEQARSDACYISEIINDLDKLGLDGGGEKYYVLLTSWQKELMKKAGFYTIEEVREYHAEHVGAENW